MLWQYMMCTSVFFICSVQGQASVTLAKIEQEIAGDFTKMWSYRKRYSSIAELKINKGALHQGIVNDGVWSRVAIEKMLYKAVTRQDVHLAVIGESSTLGADLGCRNAKRAFHYPLAHWWDQTIGKITGSLMQRKVIAVGGVGTSYFASCWKEYCERDQVIDMVFWEFGINDVNMTSYNRSIELFTRSVLKYPTKPGLMFVNFFRKDLIKAASNRLCTKQLEERHVVTLIAQYYNATSFSLERLVCNLLAADNPIADHYDFFNGKHPSVLAHAQISYMIIVYFQQLALSIIKRWKRMGFTWGYPASTVDTGVGRSMWAHPSATPDTLSLNFQRDIIARAQRVGAQQRGTILTGPISYRPRLQGNVTQVKRLLQPASSVPRTYSAPLFPKINHVMEPPPLYVDDRVFDNRPVCYTAIFVDYRARLNHSLFDLKIQHNDSFQTTVKTDWKDADETRYDSTGGYITLKGGHKLSLEFEVPENNNQTSKQGSKRKISFAVRNKFFGGQVRASLRRGKNESTVINNVTFDSSEKYHQGINVYDLAGVSPGNYILDLNTIDGGVLLCAIIVT